MTIAAARALRRCSSPTLPCGGPSRSHQIHGRRVQLRVRSASVFCSGSKCTNQALMLVTPLVLVRKLHQGIRRRRNKADDRKNGSTV